jgi:hypothetical protein
VGKVESIPGSETICDVAPESMTQARDVEESRVGAPVVLFRAAMRAEQSHAGAVLPNGLYGIAGGGGVLLNAWPCRGASWVV